MSRITKATARTAAEAGAVGWRVQCALAILITLTAFVFTTFAARAETVFNTDVYIAMPPVEGEPATQVYYGPSDSVVVPNSAFGKNGIAGYDPKHHGAKDLKKKIDELFSAVNEKYKDCGVKYEVRNIYFIRADHKDFKKNYNAEEQVLSLGVDAKTGESSLLAGFDKAATGNDAFNVLLAPLKESGEGEPGRGEEPGNTSVADISSAFKSVNRGQILIHEFGHNLGLPHKTYTGADTRNHGMSATLPDRRPGKPGVNTKSDPKLTKAECDKIKERVSKGLYDKYKKVTKTSLAPPPADDGGPRYAISPPGDTSVPVSFNGPSGLANGPGESSWIFRSGFDIGGLDRDPTGTLGTDNGMTIAPHNLLFPSNDELVTYYLLEVIHQFLWGDTLWRMNSWYRHGHSSTDELFDMVPAGPGNNLLIFSPQGVNGGLGGGLNAGPRDAENVRYGNDYHSGEYGFSAQGTIFSGPNFSILGGPVVSYGHQEVTERISGGIAGIGQTFMYHNAAEVMTYSVGGRVDVKKDLGTLFGLPVALNGGASFERQFHDTDGHAALDLNGLVNATERQNLDGSEQTNKIQVDAGLSLKITEKLDLLVGGSYRRFDTPRIEILPQQAATFQFDESDEIVGFARLNFSLGPPAHESPVFNGSVFSDRRLKHDIAHVQTLNNGLRLYAFKYLWSDTTHVGVMAQDILEAPGFRGAVRVGPGGFYQVDYGRLGLRMTTLEAWREQGMVSILRGARATDVAPRG